MTDPNPNDTPVSRDSHSYGNDDESTGTPLPFFADATLDLEEAHDIADTPEAFKPRFDATKITANKQVQLHLDLPVLSYDEEFDGEDNNSGTDNRTTGNGTNNSNRNATGATTTATTSSSNQQLPAVPTNSNKNTSNINNNREKSNFSRITSLESDVQQQDQSLPRQPPRWPRDIPWAVAFLVFVPVSFVWPILIEKHDEDVSPLVHYPLSIATLHTLWWAAVATFFLSRLLYLSVGGGEGDDARHAAAQVLTASAPVSVMVYTVLALMILTECPDAWAAALIPAWYTVRDVYLFRRWKRRSQQAGSTSRQAFFQAVTGMALDILSRSLRRASFYRVLSAILMVQLAVLILWRWALLGALGSGSWTVLIVAMVGGKWATGTVARLLSLLACGGITSWFAQQTALLRELQLESPQSVSQTRSQAQGSQNGHVDDGGLGNPDNADTDIPEAYRTVDASVYQSVLAMEDALDDDYELDDDEFMEAPSRREYARRESQNSNAAVTRSSVKSILFTGLRVSFGSIAQCGLVGGPAQFIWSQVRKAEAAQNVIAQARGDDSTGFQGMQIGSDDTSMITKLWNRINTMARGFVRGHSDLAMSHVAAYYKSYQKAARDVAILIDESG
jgi:hypothetical protein